MLRSFQVELFLSDAQTLMSVLFTVTIVIMIEIMASVPILSAVEHVNVPLVGYSPKLNFSPLKSVSMMVRSVSTSTNALEVHLNAIQMHLVSITLVVTLVVVVTRECDARFTDDGKTRMDFDECSRRMLVGPDARSCDVNAFCTSSFGEYTWTCMTEYSKFMLNERHLYQHR